MEKRKSTNKGRPQSVLEIEWLDDHGNTKFGQFKRGSKVSLADRGIPEAVANLWVSQGVVRITKIGRLPSPPSPGKYWLESKRLSKEVSFRIDEYKGRRKLSLREQIAALLLRSEKFQKESFSGPVEGGWRSGSHALEVFCNRWHINTLWTGRDKDLADYVEVGPIAVCQYPGKGGSFVNVGKNLKDNVDDDPYSEVWALDMGKMTGNYLFIRIDPWTAKDDIDWNKICEIKKKCFIDFRDKPETFSRDLCWYDLEKKYHLSFRAIAEIWGDKQNGLLGDISTMRSIANGKQRWGEYVSSRDTITGRTIFEDAIMSAIDRIKVYIRQIEGYAIDFHSSFDL